MFAAVDPNKDAINRRKHKLPLIFGVAVLDAEVACREDDREAYGEQRMVSYGLVNNRLYVAVWTENEQGIRLISVRIADSREVRKWQDGGFL